MNCPICREEHEPSRGLSFDGFGINSCGMYRDRLATFTFKQPEDVRKRLGPLWAVAQEMLAALELVAQAETEWEADTTDSATFGEFFDALRCGEAIRAAIAKAKGGAA